SYTLPPRSACPNLPLPCGFEPGGATWTMLPTADDSCGPTVCHQTLMSCMFAAENVLLGSRLTTKSFPHSQNGMGDPEYVFVMSTPSGMSAFSIQGNCLSAAPPSAAESHSASVGSRPPSHMQNAWRRCQPMQLIGSASFGPAVLVHVTAP